MCFITTKQLKSLLRKDGGWESKPFGLMEFNAFVNSLGLADVIVIGKLNAHLYNLNVINQNKTLCKIV